MKVDSVSLRPQGIALQRLSTPRSTYSRYLGYIERIEGLYRSYPHLSSMLQIGGLQSTLLGREARVLSLEIGDPLAKKAILVVGGQHRDEPAGTEIALDFAERTLQTQLIPSGHKIVVVPQVDSLGFMEDEALKKEFGPAVYEFGYDPCKDGIGVDINIYESPSGMITPQAQILKAYVERMIASRVKITLAIDLHETAVQIGENNVHQIFTVKRIDHVNPRNQYGIFTFSALKEIEIIERMFSKYEGLRRMYEALRKRILSSGGPVEHGEHFLIFENYMRYLGAESFLVETPGLFPLEERIDMGLESIAFILAKTFGKE